MLVTSFNFLFLLACTGGVDDDEEVIVIIIDDGSNEEDTDVKDNNNNGNAVYSSSISFSKMKFHAILQNDCVFIPIPFTRGGL